MAENILIISDLHLGEDLKPATGRAPLHHLAMLERELESFLDHHRKCRRDGKPWHLIINGDMVDFQSVCVLPEDGDEVSEPDEHVYGLGTRPKAARRKMLRVLERHPGVFRALAHFIAKGNRVSIVVGNHDAEFHWPVAQETFKKGIAALWAEHPSSRKPGAAGADAVEAGIEFHPWFYFQENLVWVEHGHQYDDYCSFDYVLNPVEPAREEVVLSVGAASFRYVTNHIEGSDPHQLESWDFLGFFRFFVLSRGPRQMWRLAKGYLGMAAKMLGLRRALTDPGVGEARRRTHRERLRALAARHKLSEATLVAVDELRHKPVVTNLLRLMMTLMLDRVLLGAAAAVLALVFLFALPWIWALVAVGGTLAGTWLAGALLERTRGTTDPHESMRQKPPEIRRHVSAPFVVFGHSHQPVAQPLDGGGMYFNTGTWVAVERPGLLHSFTHVVIQNDKEGPKAALHQWRDGRSTAYRPT
ncbi:MAG TPA: metallophosphoesterase [Haliangiales bacterium]|nr:metallophosphoesterase [Haliangiales bacterium]